MYSRAPLAIPRYICPQLDAIPIPSAWWTLPEQPKKATGKRQGAALGATKKWYTCYLAQLNEARESSEQDLSPSDPPVVDWTSPKVIASPTQRYLINCVIEKIHKTIQKHCIMSTVRTSKVVFSEEEEFTCDLENTSKNIEGAQEESTPAPSRGQKRERTKRNLGKSIRRSDGSSGDKQPEWTTMRRIEDSRLDILKKVR